MKFNDRVAITSIRFEGVGSSDPIRQVELSDLNFSFSENSFVRLQGDAQASHLLRIMAGLQKPVQGRVMINDQDLYEMDFKEFVPFRLNIGYTFNLGGILNNRTVKENIMLPFLYHGAKYTFAEKQAQDIISLFQIQKYQDLRPSSVPGAVRKLTCICRALALDPQVLLMDDPTSALKPEWIRALKEWIKSRRDAGKPLAVFVGCETEQLVQPFDHEVLVLNDGPARLEPSSKTGAIAV